MSKTKLPCLTCIHVPVCEHKDRYEEYFKKPLNEALDHMPDFLSVKVECKFYKTKDDFIPSIKHEPIKPLYV